MDEVSKSGKTVIFVSHQLSMIRTLCDKSILLEKGRIVTTGLVNDVIKEYVQSFSDPNFDLLSKNEIITKAKTDDLFQIVDFEIVQNQLTQTIFVNSEPLTIKIHYKILSEMTNFRVTVDLLDSYKNLVFRSFQDDMNEEPTKISKGEYISSVEIPNYFLAPKDYSFVINATIHNDRMLIKDGITLPIKIEQSGLYNKAYPGDPIRGIIAPV